MRLRSLSGLVTAITLLALSSFSPVSSSLLVDDLAKERAIATAIAVADAATRDSVLVDFERQIGEKARALRTYPGLSRQEVRKLKHAPYHAHVIASQHVGHPGEDGEALLSIPGESEYFVVERNRALLAPAALAALKLVGERFHEELDAAGLPRARVIVTSTFRSADDQKQLRRRNRNATRGTSSHEFGGSFDITYARFAPAAERGHPQYYTLGGGIAPRLQAVLNAELADRETAWNARVVERNAYAYQAALGRALIALEARGELITLREVRQPCFHVTATGRRPRA